MENLHDKVLSVEDSEALQLLTLRDIYYMCLVQGDTAQTSPTLVFMSRFYYTVPLLCF